MRTFLTKGAVGLSLGVLLLGAPAAGGEAKIGDELLANGGFQRLDARGWPAGWRGFAGARARSEAGNTWIEVGSYGSCPQEIAVEASWMKLKLRFRMRVSGVVRGEEGWQNARLAMEWQDAGGKHVDPWPDVVWAEGTTGWQQHERVYVIPRGAARLQVAPAMFGRPGGKAEYDDISLRLLRTRVTKKQDLPPPKGFEEGWDLRRAWRRASATREAICLNGLWRFLPVPDGRGAAPPPAGEGWGWFKVPGVWPRSADGEAQDVLVSPYMEDRADLAALEQAWYLRELTVPAAWKGRRVCIDFTMLQTHARVFLDGRQAGQRFFPGGEVDLTPHVRPGAAQTLAILVTARPLAAETTAFMAPDRLVKSQARIDLRGLTGDVFLISRPAAETLDDLRVVTSTRKQGITLDVGLAEPGAGGRRLMATVTEKGRAVKRFSSPRFEAGALRGGRIAFSAPWPDAKLWDTHTPGNLYDVSVSLVEDEPGRVGRVIDETLPERFGFREFWIDGRDFYLNGKRVHLRALLARNINGAADLACIEACRRTCERLKEYGFNFLITSNYHFQPGTVGYMDGLFDAADESGVLAAFSLPHFKDFAYKLDTPQQAERYRALCQWLIRRARNHPSIILYAMSHNATGYHGDQNPLRIDGVFDPEDPVHGGRPNRNRQQARLAAAIAKGIDPTRPVYHHQSGNLGDLYTINIYLNWAPRQERSDWLEHWASQGTKPLFFVEWGLPHISSWSSYRGPNFIWRSEEYQCIWDAEYNAEYLGQAAYELTPQRIRSREHEEDLWSRGKPFPWSRLIQHFRDDQDGHVRMKALFADDNWRCLRAWGISAMLPWDQEQLWRRLQGFTGGWRAAAYEPGRLQQPGIVSDRISASESYLDHGQADQIGPTVLGKSFLRWNLPLCAFVGGAPSFTDKAHNFLPGETVSKQLIILNDTREEVTCTYSCAALDEAEWKELTEHGTAPKPQRRGGLRVAPGGKESVPFEVRLRDNTEPGTYRIVATFDFDKGGREQRDEFAFHVLPKPRELKLRSRIALFDPKGMTARLLDSLGVKYEKVAADADVSKYGILVIGREAIGLDTKLPDMSAVRDGLKVLVFEQTADTLAHRLGFRVNVHGLRRVFVARSDRHPVLHGLREEHLRDWRGSATLVRPYLDIQGVEMADPKWKWCGFENTRVWRCGNRGCVASVLIEKPPVGSFWPHVDGGFDLQYAPLLEYREGKGCVVFCQLDVTGRTEADPAALAICRGLLEHLDGPLRSWARRVLYDGDERGAKLLDRLGVPYKPYAPAERQKEGRFLLVLGPGARHVIEVGGAKGLRGPDLMGLGLDRKELTRLMQGAGDAATVSAYGDQHGPQCIWLHPGISMADLSWRTKLAVHVPIYSPEHPHPLFFDYCPRGFFVCQVAPWMLDYEKKPYLRTSYRRNVFLVSHLLHSLGATAETALLERLSRPAGRNELVLPAAWKGQVDRDGAGRKAGWFRPDFDDAQWKPIAVPGMFDELFPGLTPDYNGLFWYRLRFRLPPGLAKEGLTLNVGPADDESWVWLNGRFLGEVTKQTNPKDYWTFPRKYAMQPGMLHEEGENVLVVLVNDTYLKGGLTGTPTLSAPGAWLRSYYVQTPVAGDDPYRYYRW
jgi:hypothetical protein